MRFWDTSAIVPLLVREDGTSTASHAIAQDPDIVVWWCTRVECVSALSRYAREHRMSAADLARAYARLSGLADRWTEVLATDAVRAVAERIVRTHPLRAADALQLGAAVVASDGAPGALPFTSLDARQRDAAQREGFPIVPDALPGPGPRLVREPGRRRGARSSMR